MNTAVRALRTGETGETDEMNGADRGCSGLLAASCLLRAAGCWLRDSPDIDDEDDEGEGDEEGDDDDDEGVGVDGGGLEAAFGKATEGG